MPLPSLYEICLECLAKHTDSITNLDGVAFDPFVKDLVETIYMDPQRHFQYTGLNAIGTWHGDAIRKEHTPFYTLHISAGPLPGSEPEQLRLLSTLFPRFITKLSLSMTTIEDTDLHLLRPLVNLVVLDLSATRITDLGVAHIRAMTSAGQPLIHLQVLSIALNRNITDAVLKYITRFESLKGIDITATSVSSIANTYLPKHGYDKALLLPDPIHYNHYAKYLSPLISWIHHDLALDNLGDGQPNPGYQMSLNAPLSNYLQRLTASLGTIYGHRYPTQIIPEMSNNLLCFLRRPSSPTLRRKHRSSKESDTCPASREPLAKKKTAKEYWTMFATEFGVEEV